MLKKLFILTMIIISLGSVEAAIDCGVNGFVETELLYTPEKDLSVGNRIQLYTLLQKKGNAQIDLRIIGINQKDDQLNRFDSVAKIPIALDIDAVTAKYIGALWPFGPDATLLVGNLNLQYDEYSIWMPDGLNEEWVGYSGFQGLAMEELPLGPLSGAAFILWGTDNVYKNTMGGKISWQRGGSQLKLSAIEYAWRGKDAVLGAKQDAESLPRGEGVPFYDRVGTINYKWQIGLFNTEFYYAVNAKKIIIKKAATEEPQEELSKGAVEKFTLGYKASDSATVSLTFRKVDSNFDPLYRNRQPEYHPSSHRYLGENPVDKYKNKAGYALKFISLGEKINCEAESEFYRALDSDDAFRWVTIKVNSQLNSWDFESRFKISEERTYSAMGVPNSNNFASVKLGLSKMFPLSLTVALVPSIAVRRMNANLTQPGFYEDLKMTAKFGKDKNFSCWAGLKREGDAAGEAQRYSFYGAEYTHKSGVSLVWRRANPNKSEPYFYNYDEFSDLVELDNVLQLMVKVNF